MEEFTASIRYDMRLLRHDIEGSIAHAKMLGKQGIISNEESEKIVAGLISIREDIEKGDLRFSVSLEDVHMAVESALIERIGEAGGKLHTARSRNDQIALDIRLYLREEAATILQLLAKLNETLLKRAKEEIDTLLPGCTHLQKAQPVLLAHYLLAYREMFHRDSLRMRSCYEGINVMPLGSAALAGTSIPIDRGYVARLLNFPRISKNSMDAVADRDFAAEFLFDTALIMMHLSRFCEDLIIWSTDQFGFIEMADSFTTGSSIMPQKKNPDVAELIRGKSGRVYGNLVSLLTLMKGLPMTYNRDLQEDKEPVFDSVDTVRSCLEIFEGLIGSTVFKKDKMMQDAKTGYAAATDIAEYLVTQGVPFRKAHAIVGRLVGYCIEKDKNFDELSLEEVKMFYEGAKTEIFKYFDVERSVAGKTVSGGTARQAILERIKEIEKEREVS